jgi:hypothetical protein
MKFLFAFCAFYAFALPVSALDREAFTFTRYDLSATVDPEQQRLGVRGKIVLRNDSDVPQQSAVLQISSTLHWATIKIGGKRAGFTTQTYNSDIDHTGALSEAIVSLPRALAPRQTIEIEVGYEGTIPQDTTRLTHIGVPAEAAKQSDWDQISSSFTAIRGIGYVAWYPIATEAANMADVTSVSEAVGRWKRREAPTEFDIDVCTVRKLSSPTPIEIMNEPPQAEGRGGGANGSTCGGHDYHLLGNVVPVLVVGDYLALSRSLAEIHYRDNSKSGAENYGLAIEQAAPPVGKWFGDHRERPEFKAQVVEIPASNASPFQSGNMLLTPLTDDDTGMLLSAVQLLTHVEFPSPRLLIS